MKNRKLNQLLVAGMISAAMMTSGISVQAADFSDDTSTVEEQSVGSAEEEAPVRLTKITLQSFPSPSFTNSFTVVW